MRTGIDDLAEPENESGTAIAAAYGADLGSGGNGDLAVWYHESRVLAKSFAAGHPCGLRGSLGSHLADAARRGEAGKRQADQKQQKMNERIIYIM